MKIEIGLNLDHYLRSIYHVSLYLGHWFTVYSLPHFFHFLVMYKQLPDIRSTEINSLSANIRVVSEEPAISHFGTGNWNWERAGHLQLGESQGDCYSRFQFTAPFLGDLLFKEVPVFAIAGRFLFPVLVFCCLLLESKVILGVSPRFSACFNGWPDSRPT